MGPQFPLPLTSSALAPATKTHTHRGFAHKPATVVSGYVTQSQQSTQLRINPDREISKK